MVFEPATDGHVHLFPPRLTRAIRGVLSEQRAWTFDHPEGREGIERALRRHGVDRYIALPYAHRQGVAAELNDWVLTESADSDMSVPFATVHAEDDVERVVADAFENGARGLKFQFPVQKFAIDDPRLDPAYELAVEHDRPVMAHPGTAPFYTDSPHVGADTFENFLERFPDVRVCAAHFGAYEVERFIGYAREFSNVFLDTTMAMSPKSPEYLEFDPATVADEVFEELSGCIFYGSDFPQLPYAYEEERRGLLDRDLSRSIYRDLFEHSVERFLGDA